MKTSSGSPNTGTRRGLLTTVGAALAVGTTGNIGVIAARATTPTAPVDPMFAAIDRCRQAEVAFFAACERGDEDAYRGEVAMARIALASTAATTPEGLVALTTFLLLTIEEFGFYFYNENEQALFVRSLFAAVRGMAGHASWRPFDNASARTTWVIDLLPPMRDEMEIWSGFTLDASGQRWIFGAGRDGEVKYAFREDRSAERTLWLVAKELAGPSPQELHDAVRRAVLDGEARLAAVRT